jgi:Carboxypeptidase regulatory-like domain
MLAGATVVITSHRTGDRTSVLTGPDGTFFVSALEPGIYTISIFMPGYEGLVANNFCVEAGQPATFRAALGPDRGAPARPPAAPRDPVVVFAPQPVPSVGALSSAEIQEAMAVGRRSGKLKAYQFSAGTGALFGGKGKAALFTPFLRVATATQVAAAAKRPLTENEIPAWAIQKVAWIVGSPAGQYVYSSDMDSPQFLTSVIGITIRPAGSTTAVNDVQPAWKMHLNTTCDVNIFETLLGPQFGMPATIAAFPMDVLTAGNTILFTYGSRGLPRGGGREIVLKPQIRAVKIGEADVRKWK